MLDIMTQGFIAFRGRPRTRQCGAASGHGGVKACLVSSKRSGAAPLCKRRAAYISCLTYHSEHAKPLLCAAPPPSISALRSVQLGSSSRTAHLPPALEHHVTSPPSCQQSWPPLVLFTLIFLPSPAHILIAMTDSQPQTLSASTGTTGSTGSKKDDTGSAPSTAGLALSPDTRAETSSTTLNAKNVATPGELCGFVSPRLQAMNILAYS